MENASHAVFWAIERRNFCHGSTHLQYLRRSDFKEPSWISNPINKGQGSLWRGLYPIHTTYLLTVDVLDLQGYMRFFYVERFTSMIAIYVLVWGKVKQIRAF